MILLKLNRADIENRTLFSGVEVRHITNYALSAFVEASRFELLFSTATLVMCIRHAGYTSMADQVRLELTIFSLTDCCLCHLSFWSICYSLRRQDSNLHTEAYETPRLPIAYPAILHITIPNNTYSISTSGDVSVPPIGLEPIPSRHSGIV